MKGKLFIFDGIDGSGKTTYAKYITKALKGIYIKEPKYYKKEILKNIPPLTELFLFLGDRSRVYEEVKEYLIKGKIVILDRSFPSTLAYQLKGKNLEKIINIKAYLILDHLARNHIEPDGVFIFDVPVKIAFERIKRKKTKFENKKFLERVRKAYLELSKKYNWKVVDSSKTKAEVIKEILDYLKEKFDL